MVRSQIELFKIQHNDNVPGFGTASFYICLTEKTDIYGAYDAAGDYGPYMQTFPRNALNQLGDNIDESEIIELSTGIRALSAADGWAWDDNSEDFYACDGIDFDKDLDLTNDSLLW
jgi:hypothetical protein